MRSIKAGTIVRIKRRVFGGNPGVGALMIDVYGDSFAQIMCDCGPVTCTGSELAVLLDQTPRPEPMRYRLPYGLWTCADSREVLFNRKYKPIWQRYPGGTVSATERSEWVPFVRQEWFYDDSSVPWHKSRKCKMALARCEAVLHEWGVSSSHADLPSEKDGPQ